MNLLSILKRKVSNIGKAIPHRNTFQLIHIYGFHCGEIEKTNFQPFIKPDNFSNEEVYIILSYYIKWIENRMYFEPCSKHALEALDAMLEDLGFTHLNEKRDPNIHVSLYTLINCKQEPNDYFNWFTNKVSLKDVVKIYENANVEFKDPEEVYANYLNHLKFTHKKTANEI